MSNPLGPVVYAIYVNEKLIGSPPPLDTELRQEWGKHDLFFIRIEYPRTYTGVNNMQLWPDNAPVRIIWGRRPSNIQTWYGYVNHHNVAQNADSGSKAMQITYCCIGTSKPMNTDKNRQWGEATPTYIAKKIASEYGLRAVLTKTDWVLPYETQGNMSDFAFLNHIADRVGYRFWVSGGTLYFLDPAVVLKGSTGQSVPSFRMDKMFTQIDTMRDFDMNEGDNLPGAAIAYRSIYGIDKQSGSIFDVTATTVNSPTIKQIKSDRYVTSVNEAKNIVQAWENFNQWWISARAELFGTTVLYPGKLIYLDGLQMPKGTRGYWIVTASDHVLKSSGSTYTVEDKYISQCQIMRNSSGVVPHIKNTTKVTPEFVTCSLKNDQWISDNQSVIYDGSVSAYG
jgi:phage protein D